MPLPRPGDTMHLTRAASVQFSQPIWFRVIRVHDWTTYHGWVWLDGYELNLDGEAVERRSVFVQVDGLEAPPNRPAHAARPAGRAGNMPRASSGPPRREAARRLR